MPTSSGHSPKTKITVILSADLVLQLDALLDSLGASSRSRAVEEAIQCWLSYRAQKELERQTEEYYLFFSEAGRKEDKQWSKIAACSAKDLWR